MGKRREKVVAFEVISAKFKETNLVGFHRWARTFENWEQGKKEVAVLGSRQVLCQCGI